MYHLAGWIVLKSGFFGSNFLEAVAIGLAYSLALPLGQLKTQPCQLIVDYLASVI